ncbi:MAG TPA: Gfo/Idh/MocA family oxidoreductase [Chthonomonadales bacterium]|nr:Gfo/Idh/MocA family oxidoreductase [Chthonomonadales bacterium]
MAFIRLAIIGCGAVSHEYGAIARELAEDGLARVTVTCDTIAERAEETGAWLDAPARLTDYRDAVARDDVDAVVVLTSMQQHAHIAHAALEAGKSVLVEKPMAGSVDEAVRLAEAARLSAGTLVCAPHVVLSPTFRAMLRLIRAGAIGKPLSARARYGWSGPDWGRHFYEKGGGVLADLGVYNLTTLTGLIGPAHRVAAMTGIAIPERVVNDEPMRVEAEDTAHVLLDFGDSVFAQVLTGFTMQQYRSPAVEVYGSEGTIQMLGDDWAPAGYEMWRNDAERWEVYPDPDADWPWTDGLRHLVECMLEERPTSSPPEHACHVLEIMDAAKRSSKTGAAVSLATTFDAAALAI